jgi:tetratricopeptide (TPR) repeat protein
METLASIKEAEITPTPAREMALAFYEKGDFAEARTIITESLKTLRPDEVDERLACYTLLAIVERGAKRFYEALRIETEAYPLSEHCSYDLLRAKFHNGLGITFKSIAIDQDASDYLDKALIEYTAARVLSERAGDLDFAGNLENNIALIHAALGRAAEAHEHIARARTYLKTDVIKLAQVDDTQAQVYLREGKALEALSLMLDASQVFIKHGKEKLFNDSIRTLIKAAADYNAAKDSE